MIYSIVDFYQYIYQLDLILLYILFFSTFPPPALVCFPLAAHVPVSDATFARPRAVGGASDARPAPAPLLHRPGRHLRQWRL